MAKKRKAKAQKPVATKDLEPKDVKGGKGKASFHDFSFTHHVDKASPVLMK